jgi:hypothetical protein
MDGKATVKLFETKRVRTAWNEDEEEWYFSVVDVVGILTGQPTQDGARNYWKVLKKRLVEEGNEPVTNCNRLKLFNSITHRAYGSAQVTIHGVKSPFRLSISVHSAKFLIDNTALNGIYRTGGDTLPAPFHANISGKRVGC